MIKNIARNLAKIFIGTACAAAIFSGILTAAASIAHFEDFNLYGLLDAGVFFALAFGISKKSRLCSLGILAYYVTSRMDMGSFGVTAILFTVIYALGILGCFAYHAKKWAPEPTVPSRKIPLGIAILGGVTLALGLLGFIAAFLHLLLINKHFPRGWSMLLSSPIHILMGYGLLKLNNKIRLLNLWVNFFGILGLLVFAIIKTSFIPLILTVPSMLIIFYLTRPSVKSYFTNR